MVFLFITVVALTQLITNNGVAKGYDLSPRMLELVLRQINTYLTDINKKVATEKELLFQVNGENKRAAKDFVSENVQINEMDKRHGLVRAENNLQVIDFTHNLTKEKEQSTEPPHTTELPVITEKPNVPEATNFDPDPFDDTIFYIPTTTPKKETEPEKIEMLSYMERNNVSYCYAASVAFLDMMIAMPDGLMSDFVFAFYKIISKMRKGGELNCLNFSLSKRLETFALLTRITPVEHSKAYAKNIVLALKDIDNLDVMDPSVKNAYLKFDHMFTDEEGNTLMDVIVTVHRYSNEENAHRKLVSPLTRSFIDAVLAPVNRLCGTYQLKNLIAEANAAIRIIYPDVERIVNKMRAGDDFPMESSSQAPTSTVDYNNMRRYLHHLLNNTKIVQRLKFST